MAAPDFANHFSVENIPFGIATGKAHSAPQCVTRVENAVIFLDDILREGLFDVVEIPDNVFQQDSLNSFAVLPKNVIRDVRKIIQTVVALKRVPDHAMEQITNVRMQLPFTIGDFIDFSSSLHHVKNAGRIILNDDNPPPAFFYLPPCYGGRSSSIVESGTGICRPSGLFRDKEALLEPGQRVPVIHGPTRELDYEMEFAAIIGRPLEMNKGLNVIDVDDHIFGFVVLNDWSARDIQGLEMNPLGPCNGKNFGTSISPWVVTTEALQPFEVKRTAQEYALAKHFQDPENAIYDVHMAVEVMTEGQATLIGRSNLMNLHWNIRQMITHVVSAGSGLQTGDLLATGTVSGPTRESYGCLLESTEGGTLPIVLADGTERRFLADGDTVRMTAYAGDEASGVGFGDCVGQILPCR